jgi:hypothetical protein
MCCIYRAARKWVPHLCEAKGGKAAAAEQWGLSTMSSDISTDRLDVDALKYAIGDRGTGVARISVNHKLMHSYQKARPIAAVILSVAKDLLFYQTA